MHHLNVISALTAVLAALPSGVEAAMYTKKSPVLQLTGSSYKQLIAKSNYTSIVEFYAPWCGHCQNLKPAYEKVAQNLDGLAKVAAIDCDDDANKPLCGQMGVQGFPTLKIVRPSLKAGGSPVVEDYQGARSASAITEAVVGKINNHVQTLTDKDVMSFFNKEGVRAILLTEKGKTSALLKSLAIDYLGQITFGQLRVKESNKAMAEKFGVDKFPTFAVLKDKQTSPAFYQGDLNKKDMLEFLKTWGTPNPDPAPSTKKSKTKKGKVEDSQKEKMAAEGSDNPAASPEEPVGAAETPQATPQPHASSIPISTVAEFSVLSKACLQPKSHTCVLAFVPAETSTDGELAVASLTSLNTKYVKGKRHMFPFFAVPDHVEGVSGLKSVLGVDKAEVSMVALNARRRWQRDYEGDFSEASVESWLDAMRMGEGEKKKLADEAIVEGQEEEDTVTAEEPSSEATQATGPEPEIETEPPTTRDEL